MKLVTENGLEVIVTEDGVTATGPDAELVMAYVQSGTPVRGPEGSEIEASPESVGAVITFLTGDIARPVGRLDKSFRYRHLVPPPAQEDHAPEPMVGVMRRFGRWVWNDLLTR